MNNGNQLPFNLNTDLLAAIVKRQQQQREMTQQRGPQISPAVLEQIRGLAAASRGGGVQTAAAPQQQRVVSNPPPPAVPGSTSSNMSPAALLRLRALRQAQQQQVVSAAANNPALLAALTAAAAGGGGGGGSSLTSGSTSLPSDALSTAHNTVLQGRAVGGASVGGSADLLLHGGSIACSSSIAASKKRKQAAAVHHEADDTISAMTTDTKTKAPDHVVDKSKVEAAFKSKPQPGKKRADLTEAERQELAKARNREHARQARMRKKARHEQLMHSEDMLLKMHKNEELKNKRCQNIFRFLSVRGYMLMHMKEEDGNKDSTSSSQKLADSVACTSLLSEVIKDMNKFHFTACGVMLLQQQQHANGTSGTEEEEEIAASMNDMREWDKALKRRLVTKFGPGCTDKLVNYKVINGKNGVALSADHTGFARVEVTIKVNGVSKVVLTGILITHFVEDSAEFDGVSWATMMINEQ